LWRSVAQLLPIHSRRARKTIRGSGKSMAGETVINAHFNNGRVEKYTIHL